jgi:hypothetical protein
MVSTLKGLRLFTTRVWLSIDATLSGLLPFLGFTQGSSQARNPGLNYETPLGYLIGFQHSGAQIKTSRSSFAFCHLPSWT